MERIALSLVAAAIVAGVAASTPRASGHTDERIAPIVGIAIPDGYRDWKLISVAHEAGDLNDIRAILGNDVAIKAYREQSFVAGPPTNVQFMVKDSKRYSATGGWGFAQFTNGKPVNEAEPKTCFSCHEPAKVRDFIFTHYVP